MMEKIRNKEGSPSSREEISMRIYSWHEQVTIIAFLVLTFVTAGAPAAGETKGFVKPAERDKCPVCGMFVAKYPDWVAEVLFKDGSYAVFDGVKDLMKYWFDMASYGKGRQRSDIKAVIVTDYYQVNPIDGREAFFVLGSDVYGPMGRELVPFAKESDAREFLKDHQGKRILRFADITQAIVAELDR
jgi:nitrous oxide reductase accessory protein NosL